MQLHLALPDVYSFVSTHAAVAPIAGAALVGWAIAAYRGSLSKFRLFRSRDAESLMNFSSLGTLRCVCKAKHGDHGADRRQFCRSCGCEVVAQDTALLDKQISSKEIKTITRSLQRAAIRASHLELPPSITTIEELHRYLDSSEPKNSRTPPTQPTSVEQPQVR